MKVSVIGCGAWATTIAKLCAENGNNVFLWTHKHAYIDYFYHGENRQALPGIKLPKIQATTSLQDTLHNAQFVLYCVPTQFRETLDFFIAHTPHIPILCLSKGVLDAPAWTLSSTLEKTLKIHQIATLSGPNLAREIALEKPSAAVVGCTNSDVAKQFATLLTRPYFRVYVSPDREGVAWGGILKNYLAIAAGITDGLQLGTNAKAALLTRGLAEITRIATVFGGQRETLYGLSGVGDLIATCSSTESRNYQVGLEIAKSPFVSQPPVPEQGIAEGIKTVRLLYEWNKTEKLPLPILDQLYHVLYKSTSVHDAMAILMGRETGSE